MAINLAIPNLMLILAVRSLDSTAIHRRGNENDLTVWVKTRRKEEINRKKKLTDREKRSRKTNMGGDRKKKLEEKEGGIRKVKKK